MQRMIEDTIGEENQPEIDEHGALRLLDKNPAQWVGLARNNPAQVEAEMERLSVEDKVALTSAVSAAERSELLYLIPEARPVIQALPEKVFYETVLARGKWETQELIEMASETQIQFLIDRDCWAGERLDKRKFNDWLRLFMECDDSEVYRLLTAISPDTLLLSLKNHVRFKRDIMIDDKYYCDPDWVSVSNTTMRLFIERLYALDPNLWVRLMGWVRTHTKPTIEADALEGHERRMRGMGFPDYALAISIYYPVDFDAQGLVDRMRLEMDQAPAPTTVPMLNKRSRLFVRRVVEGDENDSFTGWMSWDGFMTKLVTVANKVMVADQADDANREHQREILDKVQRWINLGLEADSGGDIAVARNRLQQDGPEFCFRAASMMYDALIAAVMAIEKKEHISGNKLRLGDQAHIYLPLTEPEPHIPDAAHTAAGRPIVTLDEYRYAWRLIRYFEQVLRGG